MWVHVLRITTLILGLSNDVCDECLASAGTPPGLAPPALVFQPARPSLPAKNDAVDVGALARFSFVFLLSLQGRVRCKAGFPHAMIIGASSMPV
uniref:Secreted protein n=1 Tax=Timema tahoe TaxID=61484 RepID=A0A7R9IHZ0_9NEOP|nr:unnamed protein product [Timema tahoe]